jgi:hypothetical protein
MKINWKLTILAGLVGTLVFDLIGLLLTGTWWDLPALLDGKLGTGLAGGVLAHYGNGVILAVIYAAIAPSLWGPSWSRALTYVSIQTVFGVWLFMLPLLDAGIAGLKMSAMMPVITLVRHWGYGLVLAWLVPVASQAVANQAARSGQSLGIAAQQQS